MYNETRHESTLQPCNVKLKSRPDTTRSSQNVRVKLGISLIPDGHGRHSQASASQANYQESGAAL